MIKLKQILRYPVLLLLPVYLIALGNSISNRHIHILPNGLIISHAHPFEKGDTPGKNKHNHTQTQYFFYQTFSDLPHISESTTSDVSVILPETETEYRTFISLYLSESVSSSPGRSPPLC